MLMAMVERRNQIPHLMKLRGLTIYALAKEAQMPWHQVNKIVSSTQIPDAIEYKTLRKLAEALNVPLDDLEKEE